MLERVALKSLIWDFRVQIVAWRPVILYFWCFSSVPSENRLKRTLNYGTTCSFQITSNSLFNYHHTLRCYTGSPRNTNVKWLSYTKSRLFAMFSSAEDAVTLSLIHGTNAFVAWFVRTFLRDVHLSCLNQHRSALYHTWNRHEFCSKVEKYSRVQPTFVSISVQKIRILVLKNLVNYWRLKLIYIIHWDSVRTSQRTLFFHYKDKWVM